MKGHISASAASGVLQKSLDILNFVVESAYLFGRVSHESRNTMTKVSYSIQNSRVAIAHSIFFNIRSPGSFWASDTS